MSQQPLLQALQRELALEKAARQELERQTVLKTRQLWHLREEKDKEVQQYQEQLSVLRASLILAHKQQHTHTQQHSDPYDSIQQQRSPDHQQAPAAQQPLDQCITQQDEDASPTKADQRKAAKQQLAAPDSPHKRRDSGQHKHPQQQQQRYQQEQQQQQQQQQAGVGLGAQQQHTSGSAAAITPKGRSDVAAAPAAGDKAAALEQTGQATGTATAPADIDSSSNNSTAAGLLLQQQQQQETLQTAEQLLAAAGKVQQLVEQLSATEPSAAADLSVLQWQLTAIYGSLARSSSRAESPADNSTSNSSSSSGQPEGQRPGGVLQGVACTGSDPLSASCSPAAARSGTAQSKVDAAVGSSPPPHTQAAAGPQPGVQEQQQEQGLQAASRTAAAAQLFSGAANNSGSGTKLVAASLLWYYLEPADPPIVKGPYDAGLMLRWFLKGFLDNALRIAGVVQTSSSSGGSSRAPPECIANFLPLGQLLQQVQAGHGYTPAPPGKEQQQQQQQQSSPARRPAPGVRLSRQQLSGSGGSSGSLYEGVGTAGLEGGGVSGDGLLAKGGSILSESVAYWLDMAASAQLPGSLSLVDILDKVIGNVAPQTRPV